MDWNIFWSAFGAIGTTIGSLITAIAVVVAVKQYRQPLAKKIMVEYGSGLAALDSKVTENSYMWIAVKNSGIRTVVITGVYLYSKRTNKKYYLNAMQAKDLPQIQFPYQLNAENCINFNIIYEQIVEELALMQQRGIIGRKLKFSICVQDAIGAMHFARKKIRFINGKFR